MAEGITLNAGDWIEADGREHQANAAGDHAFEDVFPAERGDEAYAENRHHEKFRRAERKHQRANDGYGGAESNAGKDRADQRAHEHGTQGAAGFAVARHAMTVDDRRCGSRFAGNAEENRSNISGGGSDRGHAKQKGKGLDGIHLEHEREHERHRGGTAEAGQDSDDEADRNADQHQIERRKIETLKKPRD